MKFRALLFGVGLIFSLTPAAAMATTTPVVQKPYCTLSSSRSAVELGKTVNLSWQSRYATQGFITSIGTVGTNGTQGVIPTGSGTTYVGTFTGSGGTGNCSITVSVIQSSGGVVPEPDKLPPSQSADAPTTLPPANEITLDKTPGKGLIPCGQSTAPPGSAQYYKDATSCQACDLASLAQKIINFLLGLSIPLAAAMFAWAGVIYFTASATGSIEKAHKIFKSVGIGFLIVLCAWLGVQTVLKTILDPSYYAGWNTIQCVKPESRPMNATISQLLSVLPGLNTNTLAPASGPSSFDNRFVGEYGASTPTCGDGYQLAYDMGGNQTCWNSSSDSYQNPVYSSSAAGNSGVGTAQWAQQLTEACSTSGLDSTNCLLAQAIMANESSGRSGVISGAGAVGLMQVLPTTACSMDSSISGCGSCQSKADNTNGNCSGVSQALLDPSLNMRMGTQEIANLGQRFNFDPALIAAGYNGGAGANRSSNTCQGMTVWQCTSNPGYAETRNYVPKVLGTFSKLK